MVVFWIMKECNPLGAGLVFFSLGLAIYGAGCAKAGGLTAEQTSQAVMLQVVDSTVGPLNAVLNDAEQATSLQSLAACSTARYSPAAGSANCTGSVGNKTVTSTYACDASATLGIALAGTATLTFDAAATCTSWITAAIPASGAMNWTSNSLTRTGTQGSIQTTSAIHSNYLNTPYSGGATVTYASGPMSLAISGLHRTGSLNSISVDHTLHTSLPIAITNPKSSHGRPVTAGQLVIDDNSNLFTATATFSNLTWNTSGCCYPTSGTISYVFTGKLTGTGSADFGTGACGTVNVTGTTGSTASVTLQSCE